jgi:hypothetical protein
VFLNEHLDLTKITAIGVALVAAMALGKENGVQPVTVASPSQEA